MTKRREDRDPDREIRLSDLSGRGMKVEGGGETKAPPRLLGESVEDRITARMSGNAQYMKGRRDVVLEIYESGGLNEGRVALEILYLLPDRFVDFYSNLFHRALSGGGGESVMHGRSGGLDKASGTKGMALGSENKLQSAGSGKKYKNTPLLIGNEGALKVKEQVDRELLRIMKWAVDELRIRVQEASKNKPHDTGTRVTGSGGTETKVTESTGNSGEGSRKCRGAGCGRFVSANWVYCPSCGTVVIRERA